MKDRFTGENSRLLYDLMHYLEENDMDGLLLLVDFEKQISYMSIFYHTTFRVYIKSFKPLANRRTKIKTV
jgi:hypothetical protein